MEGLFALGIDRRDAIDDHLANPRGESLSRLSIVFVCLSGLFVSLRLLTRYLRGRLLGIDDALIVGALVLAVCMTVTYNEGLFAKHATTSSDLC